MEKQAQNSQRRASSESALPKTTAFETSTHLAAKGVYFRYIHIFANL